MPSTTFNWRDQSAILPDVRTKNIENIDENSKEYLTGRISTLTVRLSRSKDPIERAELSDAISACQMKLQHLKSGSNELQAKPVSDAPSIADKKHVGNITNESRVSLSSGQILGNSNSFVSII